MSRRSQTEILQAGIERGDRCIRIRPRRCAGRVIKIELYRTCVDEGVVGKASHALRTCFPEDAERYIDESFLWLPKERRLYAIRNAIDHGDIDADNLQELMQVEGRHRQLWMIVFRMLGKFIPFGAPADSSGRVRTSRCEVTPRPLTLVVSAAGGLQAMDEWAAWRKASGTMCSP